jgi:hypothetical protein
VADSRARSTCNGDSTYRAFPADHATASYPTSPVAGTRGVAGVCEAAMRTWDVFVLEAGVRQEVP